MKKKKQINFLYFADEKGKQQTNIAYVPGFYWGEHLDDISVKCEIIGGKIALSPVIESWMDKDEIEALKYEFKNGTISDSWEYLRFYPTEELKTKEDYLVLYADKNSSMFDVLNSPQNMKNIQNFKDKFGK